MVFCSVAVRVSDIAAGSIDRSGRRFSSSVVELER